MQISNIFLKVIQQTYIQGHGRMANALKEPQASLVYFVVRDEDSKADIVFQTADTTWQVSKSSDILH